MAAVRQLGRASSRVARLWALPATTVRCPLVQPLVLSTPLRSFAAAAEPKGKGGDEDKEVVYLDDADWRRFTPEALVMRVWNHGRRWMDKLRGTRRYPDQVTVCNAGADFGIVLPQPGLVLHEGIERDSKEWRMQLYGAALCWHLATTPGADPMVSSAELLRGKEVLEVACKRGGGARYLAEVAGAERYMAVDADAADIQFCRERHTPLPSLTFDVADASRLKEAVAAESFDVVLSVEPGLMTQEPGTFLEGVAHSLRPGGRLLLCDLLTSARLGQIQRSADALGFSEEVCVDMSRAVVVAGLSAVPQGSLYLRLILRKNA